MTTDTYTVRNEETTFPECLLICPTGLPMPTTERAAYVSHNQAVIAWQRTRVGAVVHSTPAEGAILDLAAAIYNWTQILGDPFAAEHIIAPLVDGFIEALNYETGRLECGTLSDWSHALLVSVGIDPDTYAWMGGDQS